MILIFGGAYQGKLNYALENFDAVTVSDCRGGGTPDFTKDIIYGIEDFVLSCVEEGREAADFFRGNREKWQDKILIVTDASQGIVPVDSRLREMREMNGRLTIYLANEADKVIRIFCGLGKKVK